MADFAAAQERILARRAAREARESAARSQTTQLRAERFAALPPSLRGLAFNAYRVWDLVGSPYSTRPAFRVGQVDAELLDEELLSLLKNQAADGLKLFGAHLQDDWSNEISLALRTILWKLSIWDHGASYGASLQGLKYINARNMRKSPHTQRNGQQAEATRLQRILNGILSVGGGYTWSRWEDHLANVQNNYDGPSPFMRRLSRISTLANSTYSVAAFLSFLVFLYNGRYRTLTDRLLRMRLVPSSNQTNREVSFEFLNRQLVWHAFTEFLLFILPLVGISRWRRWLSRGWKKIKTNLNQLRAGNVDGTTEDEELAPTGELAFLPQRTCAICYQDQNPASGQSEQDVISAGANAGIIGNVSTDITNPYSAIPCGCVYCFVCLTQRIEAEEGEGWTCLRCATVTKECKPWDGDVVEVVSSDDAMPQANRRSIAWADDVVDKEETESATEEALAANVAAVQ